MNARKPTFLEWLASTVVALIIVPAAALAVPIQMTPNPLGDWIAPSAVTANVSLQSGDTQPVSMVVLRTRVDGTLLALSSVNFDFWFDIGVVSASVSAQSGNITIGPLLSGSADPRFRRLAFVCGQTVRPVAARRSSPTQRTPLRDRA